MGAIIFNGVAFAHLAPPSLVVMDGQEDLPSLSALCSQPRPRTPRPSPLDVIGIELNPLPGGCFLFLHLLEDASPAFGPNKQRRFCPGPAPEWGVFTAELAQVMVTWQEPSTRYFLQADEDGICLVW